MEVLSWFLPPSFGFAIGYVTNALAIRMLFRPHREVRFLGLRFQGMIPRRKGDIAATISRTVVSELLREESVAARLAGPEVRSALQALALDLWGRYLARARGTVAEFLGEASSQAATRALGQLVPEAARAVQRWAATREGVAFCEGLLASLLERTPGELLRGEELLAARAVQARLSQWVSAPGLETRLRPGVARVLVALAGSDLPIGRLLPTGIREAALEAIHPVVPALLQRFGEALLAPPNVRRLKIAVRDGIETYLLETEGGIVKNLVRQAALMGRSRIYQEADEIVDANLHRLRELVLREENRAHLEKGIGEALDRLLARTAAELLEALPPRALEGLHGQVAAWVCEQLRRPQVGEALSHFVQRELEHLSASTLRDLARGAGLGENPARRWALQLARWATEGGIESLAGREQERIVRGLLRMELGRAERNVPLLLVAEVTGVALDHLMPVISARVPEILQIVDVQGLVEREVLGFSPEEVERVILTVAGRELRSITWWGGILGALVGGLQSVLALWLH
jgi:uncharacterized membrane protein YheB (UPF0754 family)